VRASIARIKATAAKAATTSAAASDHAARRAADECADDTEATALLVDFLRSAQSRRAHDVNPSVSRTAAPA